MEYSVQIVLAVIAAVGGSSGLWAYLTARHNKKSTNTRLLMGLAHDRIVHLGMSYIDRGWVTRDEYDDLLQYLWKPYSEFGGNGLAEKIVADVSKLPIYSRSRSVEMVRESLSLDVKEKNER